MILGVGLYALFGALVMQKLETKTIHRSHRSTPEEEGLHGSIQYGEDRAFSCMF